jgi:hypothetical protein
MRWNLHASDQTGRLLAAQGATQKKDTLRQAPLRDHMSTIAHIARADLPNSPAREPLSMPRGQPTVEKLAAAAAGMAEAAEAIRRRLHGGGTGAGTDSPT